MNIDINTIFYALGFMQGLSVAGDQIISWPYNRSLPTSDELQQWESNFQSHINGMTPSQLSTFIQSIANPS